MRGPWSVTFDLWALNSRCVGFCIWRRMEVVLDEPFVCVSYVVFMRGRRDILDMRDRCDECGGEL